MGTGGSTEAEPATGSSPGPITSTGADQTPGRRKELPARSGAAAEEPIALTELAEGVRFDALRNALYHSARRGWYEMLHRTLMFVVVIAGSGVVALLGQSTTAFSVIAALLTAIAGALDLVFDFNGKACEHTYLSRRCYEILAALTEDESEDTVRRARADMVRLYADERPQLRALDAIAYNAAADSLYGTGRQRMIVTGAQSFWRHLYPFNSTEFPVREGRTPGG